jgi:hypothetical protein
MAHLETFLPNTYSYQSYRNVSEASTMRPATISEARRLLEQLCHRDDWQRLKDISHIFFPEATRVVVTQSIDRSGVRVCGLEFFLRHRSLHFLTLTEQERLERIGADVLMSANYDPEFETLGYLQDCFDTVVEDLISLESTVFDDRLEFDLEIEPSANGQLYVDEP